MPSEKSTPEEVEKAEVEKARKWRESECRQDILHFMASTKDEGILDNILSAYHAHRERETWVRVEDRPHPDIKDQKYEFRMNWLGKITHWRPLPEPPEEGKCRGMMRFCQVNNHEQQNRGGSHDREAGTIDRFARDWRDSARRAGQGAGVSGDQAQAQQAETPNAWGTPSPSGMEGNSITDGLGVEVRDGLHISRYGSTGQDGGSFAHPRPRHSQGSGEVNSIWYFLCTWFAAWVAMIALVTIIRGYSRLSPMPSDEVWFVILCSAAISAALTAAKLVERNLP